jgi:hypothetical protein
VSPCPASPVEEAKRMRGNEIQTGMSIRQRFETGSLTDSDFCLIR